jgi:hypothetical protein
VDNLAVSGEHAAIITILNDSFIEDLNSTNGTLVNGKPIKKHFLQNNDVIEIGKHKLKFFSDAPVLSAAADFERTMIIRKPSAASMPAAGASLLARQADMRPVAATMAPPSAPAAAPPAAPIAPGAASAVAPVREAAIQVLSGAAAGRTLDLIKNLTTIGKPGVQVAVITRRPAGFYITHVEGKSPLTINGIGLGGQAQLLHDHDLIDIAGVKIEFFFKP